jgi:dihydroneopterin triphosphate diphosphatase
VHKLPLSVLVVMHDAQCNVLLLERAKQPDFWQSVTGSKDLLDEPWATTAAREVAEETGVVAPPEAFTDWALENVYEIYPIWRHRYAPGVTHNTERVFSLCIDRATPIVLAPREHTQFVWLPWREAADKCFSPSNAEAILQLPSRLTIVD